MNNQYKNPASINGILNMNWLKERAAEMTPEKAQAIIKRNEALRNIPFEKREEWLKAHPLEFFMKNSQDIECQENALELE